MKLTSLLLKLADKFGRLDTEEFDKLAQDTNKWWTGIKTDEESIKKAKEEGKAMEVFEAKLKLMSDKVLVRFLLIALYIYLYRAITDYMNPKTSIENENEDN